MKKVLVNRKRNDSSAVYKTEKSVLLLEQQSLFSVTNFRLLQILAQWCKWLHLNLFSLWIQRSNTKHSSFGSQDVFPNHPEYKPQDFLPELNAFLNYQHGINSGPPGGCPPATLRPTCSPAWKSCRATHSQRSSSRLYPVVIWR